MSCLDTERGRKKGDELQRTNGGARGDGRLDLDMEDHDRAQVGVAGF